MYVLSKNQTRKHVLNITNNNGHLTEQLGGFLLQKIRILENVFFFQKTVTNIGKKLHFYGNGCIFRK